MFPIGSRHNQIEDSRGETVELRPIDDARRRSFCLARTPMDPHQRAAELTRELYTLGPPAPAWAYLAGVWVSPSMWGAMLTLVFIFTKPLGTLQLHGWRAVPRLAAWFVASMCAVGFGVWVWSAFRRRWLVRHLAPLPRACPACAYVLDGLPTDVDGCTVCPECGGAWRYQAESAENP